MRKTMGGYGNPYNIAPKREWTTWFGYAVLLVIAAGDAAAFYQLAAKAMQDIWAPLLWILIVAFSAAATVSMHQAGEWGRASGTKERNHVPSRLWFAVILLAWLGMGTMALWFRIVSYSATPPNAASGDSLLSTVSADAGATALPISVMMFMLYLVGGATAYGIGFKMHNPAKKAYLRAVKAQEQRARDLQDALEARDKSAVAASDPDAVEVAAPVVGLAQGLRQLHQSPDQQVSRAFDRSVVAPAASEDGIIADDNPADRALADANAERGWSTEESRKPQVTADVTADAAADHPRDPVRHADDLILASEDGIIPDENPAHRALADVSAVRGWSTEDLRQPRETANVTADAAADHPRDPVAHTDDLILASTYHAEPEPPQMSHEHYEQSRARAREQAHHQARQLRQHVRHRLAMSLGDPGSTSGVFHQPTLTDGKDR